MESSSLRQKFSDKVPVVTLEACIDCPAHQYCTKHQLFYICEFPECGASLKSVEDWHRHKRRHSNSRHAQCVVHSRYDIYANSLERRIQEKFKAPAFKLRRKRKDVRLGSFEVSAGNQTGRKSEFVFSKLEKRVWPNIDVLVDRLYDQLYLEHLRTLEVQTCGRMLEKLFSKALSVQKHALDILRAKTDGVSISLDVLIECALDLQANEHQGTKVGEKYGEIAKLLSNFECREGELDYEEILLTIMAADLEGDVDLPKPRSEANAQQQAKTSLQRPWSAVPSGARKPSKNYVLPKETSPKPRPKKPGVPRFSSAKQNKRDKHLYTGDIRTEKHRHDDHEEKEEGKVHDQMTFAIPKPLSTMTIEDRPRSGVNILNSPEEQLPTFEQLKQNLNQVFKPGDGLSDDGDSHYDEDIMNDFEDDDDDDYNEDHFDVPTPNQKPKFGDDSDSIPSEIESMASDVDSVASY